MAAEEALRRKVSLTVLQRRSTAGVFGVLAATPQWPSVAGGELGDQAHERARRTVVALHAAHTGMDVRVELVVGDAVRAGPPARGISLLMLRAPGLRVSHASPLATVSNEILRQADRTVLVVPHEHERHTTRTLDTTQGR